MTIGTKIYTMIFGKEVGRDSQANVYYCAKRPAAGAKQKRWVVYDGQAAASRVPPAWHSWLHHTTNDIPTDDVGRHWEWQRRHVPNMTGTAGAYQPPGHVEKGGVRASATGDYEPWKPS